jgi:hypothetical protein
MRVRNFNVFIHKFEFPTIQNGRHLIGPLLFDLFFN